ncbi:MAG: class I SAM-dependent methyltransferase [Arcanobacterium sp.]|nr:class I SAM-dependent methyltransferase [Arcanobacterium sp.]MDY5589487.1 class I SAM-dependent methyltransferase [Arcanobacterium sp.]
MERDGIAHVAHSRAALAQLSSSRQAAVGENFPAGALPSSNPFELAGAGAAAYADVRPSYPESAVTWAVQGVHIGARVADIGAGAGRLTAALVSRGFEVWAVEPATDMRVEFLECLPDFPRTHLLATTAEATGLEDRFCDALTYGESWHWLERSRATTEAWRLLRPGGSVALLYNQLAVEHPWVHRLTRIMRSGDVQRPDKPPVLGDQFSTPQFFSVDWEHAVTPEHIIALGTTRASWLRASHEQRVRMRRNLVWYLYTELGMRPGEPVALPYHTYVWRAWRR